MSGAWIRNTGINNDKLDNLLLRWYWELKHFQLKKTRLSNEEDPVGNAIY